MKEEKHRVTAGSDPAGGTVTPGADGAPGHGLRLAPARAAPYRTA
ncbi:hypothetical protein ACFXAF_30175 [Kitasatospora sp. NPDC059463]